MAEAPGVVQVFDVPGSLAFQPAQLAGLRVNESDAVTWVDMLAPSREMLHLVGERFQFHPLAVEDAIKRRQRPKLDVYEDHLFFVLYELDFVPERQQLAAQELAVFVSGSVVVTVHAAELEQLKVAERRWAEHCRESQQLTAGMLVYTIADAIVDGYFPCMDRIAEDIDVLETRMFSDAVEDVLQDIFTLKRCLLEMRRLTAPTREVFNSFTRREIAVLGEDAIIYFQDIYDHVIRVTDAIDADREVLSSAIDVHLSLQSNRMNQTVRTLTAASIVLMSMTLIAGIYGMNFPLTPSGNWAGGFWLAISSMVVLGGVLGAWFRRLGWW